MIVVDSYGWIEYFRGGPLADEYGRYLEKPDAVLTPAVVVYEVYKKIKRERGERDALLALDQMKRTRIVPLDDALAARAADLSLKHSIGMADAMVYATGRELGAEVVTSDPDLKGLPGVTMLTAPSRTK